MGKVFFLPTLSLVGYILILMIFMSQVGFAHLKLCKGIAYLPSFDLKNYRNRKAFWKRFTVLP
ncbi:MAG: hypothetical protein DRR19_33125 [Candidatus Parabeggiatoa sp. nov. 1]|nr:MAG: hypothetical protein DRR19_33125 [Gammaproteobacteria bacterium]